MFELLEPLGDRSLACEQLRRGLVESALRVVDSLLCSGAVSEYLPLTIEALARKCNLCLRRVQVSSRRIEPRFEGVLLTPIARTLHRGDLIAPTDQLSVFVEGGTTHLATLIKDGQHSSAHFEANPFFAIQIHRAGQGVLSREVALE